MELTELVGRCLEGDKLAWEVLVRNYQSRIYGFAYGYVGNADEARDLAQDIFIRIYQKLGTCRDPERFLPWTIRIARNVCVDHLRRRKVRPAAHDTPVDEMFDLASDGPDPEERFTAESRKQLIHQGLQELSRINREVILLKDIQDLKLTEVASVLKVPVGTIKSRLNRARIELARAVLALSSRPDSETP